ncbi:hypothetical protein [Brevibacterium album]|uniref:hypothetical protein n=1 Tax=Brevibacterium album TaxID=417948 RepID=UPI0003FEA474|nr:hypothetical protein [Brevibacterium album]
MPEDIEGQEPEAQNIEPAAPADSTNEPGEDDLPEWARKSLKKANDEAASYRTQLREAQEQLKAAKSPEEHEAAVSALNERIVDQDRRLAAKDHGVPDDLLEFITATDPEGIEKQAKKLAASVATQDPAPAPPESKQPPAGARQTKRADSTLNPVDAARLSLQRR